MHTPSEDEPGTVPLAVTRAQPRAEHPLAAMSATPSPPVESVDGANGSNGHRVQDQVGQPWLKRYRLSGPWRRRLTLAAWPVGLAAAGVVLFLCYLAVSRTLAVTSDGASNAVQAWDMLHGNPLLRGWTVTDVSFYTTELPEYMIVEWVHGLNADVLHVSAAISYALVVLTGGLLGRAGPEAARALSASSSPPGSWSRPSLAQACSSWSSSPITSVPRFRCC
jgi:hypothetical protein